MGNKNRKKQYVPNMELEVIYGKNIAKIWKGNVFLLFFVYIFNLGYPERIQAFDFMMLILNGYLFWYLKPMVLSGKKILYYRKSYSSFKYPFLISMFLIRGAVLRVGTILFVKIGNVLILYKKGEMRELAEQKTAFLDLYDPYAYLTAIVFVFLFILIFFRINKFISSKEYSNNLVALCRSEGMNSYTAHEFVISLQERKCDIMKNKEAKYDKEDGERFLEEHFGNKVEAKEESKEIFKEEKIRRKRRA